MGEQEVFPHVGENTAIRLRGARSAVFPLVTVSLCLLDVT
jgi:hypothetical protein